MERNFIVYKSGAGSGKTFTLVKEYLKLALCDPYKIRYRYRSILALTFTNKAAEEMRSRILKNLREILDSAGENTLSGLLITELRILPEELVKRADLLFQSILHHYTDFAVSTIDSFSHRIIKTFAHDLDLPVGFNIETDTSQFYEKVVHKLLSKIGEDSDITSILKVFSIENIEEAKTWDPEEQLISFTNLIQKENALDHARNIAPLSVKELKAIKEQLYTFNAGYRQYITENGRKGITLVQKAGFNNESFKFKSKGLQWFLEKCMEFELEENNEIGERIRMAILNNDWLNEKQVLQPSENIQVIKEEIQKLAQGLIDFIDKNKSRYYRNRILLKNLYPILLFGQLQKIIEEIKNEEQVVFIEEFNARIFEFIKNEPVSYIYERLGNRYKHYFIDEFQDTSTLQWLNLLPLVTNSLAEGNLNLIVGDGKQSIYRWRNANVNQFAKLPHIKNSENSEILHEEENSLIRNYHGANLNTNYRSTSTIVEFNNSLFEYLSNMLLQETGKTIYSGHNQNIHNTENGYVSIYTKPCPAEQLNDLNISKTIEYIRAAIRDGFEYKDICILTYRNKTGNEIANKLSEAGFPVISNDSLLLKNNLQVSLICSFIYHISNSKDQIHLTNILKILIQMGKIKYVSLHEAFKECNGMGLWEFLEKNELSLNHTEIKTLNIYDFCIYIIEKLQLNDSVNADIYLRFFLDEVLNYLNKNNASNDGFTAWWDKRKEKSSLIISANSNAIRIMTIHSSKGLEFPIVILPFCNWDFGKDTVKWVELHQESIPLKSMFLLMSKKAESAGFKKEYEEEEQNKVIDNLNVLYVALTRAVKKLHLICSVGEKNKRFHIGKWLESYLSENSLFQIHEEDYVFGKAVVTPDINNDLPSTTKIPKINIKHVNEQVRIKSKYGVDQIHTENAKLRGIQLHFALSRINRLTDINSVLSRMVISGQINNTQQKEYERILHELLSKPEILSYFSGLGRTFNERELINTEGDLLRPDKVIENGNEICIIDYKTGKEDIKRHSDQLRNYEKSISSFQNKKIKKLLIYLEESKIIEIE